MFVIKLINLHTVDNLIDGIPISIYLPCLHDIYDRLEQAHYCGNCQTWAFQMIKKTGFEHLVFEIY